MMSSIHFQKQNQLFGNSGEEQLVVQYLSLNYKAVGSITTQLNTHTMTFIGTSLIITVFMVKTILE